MTILLRLQYWGSHSSEILGVASNSIIKVKVSELQKSRRDTVGYFNINEVWCKFIYKR